MKARASHRAALEESSETMTRAGRAATVASASPGHGEQRERQLQARLDGDHGDEAHERQDAGGHHSGGQQPERRGGQQGARWDVQAQVDGEHGGAGDDDEQGLEDGPEHVEPRHQPEARQRDAARQRRGRRHEEVPSTAGARVAASGGAGPAPAPSARGLSSSRRSESIRCGRSTAAPRDAEPMGPPSMALQRAALPTEQAPCPWGRSGESLRARTEPLAAGGHELGAGQRYVTRYPGAPGVTARTSGVDLLVPREYLDEMRDALLRVSRVSSRSGCARVRRSGSPRRAWRKTRRRGGLRRARPLDPRARWRGSASRMPLPASIALRALDLREPRRLHLACRDEGQRLLPVDLRPHALRAARRELLEPSRLVVAPLLAVDSSPRRAPPRAPPHR